MSKNGETRMAVYDFIYDRIMSGMPAPTVREICTALRLKSTSTAHLHLTNLQKEGFIDFDRNLQRTVRLTENIPAASKAFRKNAAAEKEKKKLSAASARIPLVGKVAAGLPILAFDDRAESYTLPRELLRSAEPEETFLLTVDGESMIDAGILTGDLILVTRSFDIREGDIVVARINGDTATVKRIFRENGKVRLQPENSAMEPIIVSGAEVEVVGKVIGLMRSY
ncbi:MAG: transcriptional repressor LexA [Clostridia bacterium]|nr:transcriptional repressor LexA [Clostridia bacterium]